MSTPWECALAPAPLITQALVNENMDHATANGYFLDLSKVTVAEIVTDLQLYSADLDMAETEVLTPLVKIWYDARRSLESGEVGNAPDC